MSKKTDSQQQQEQEQYQYTVALNGTIYNLNTSIRESIQDRARRAYDENESFSCWWKVASPDQYDSDDEWQDTVHESGDPVLVIETMGVMVPWDRLDRLEPETMREDDSEDDSDGTDRTHFRQAAVTEELVEDPDGEDEAELPPAPTEMPDESVLVKWLPDHPDIEHTWATGEAMIPTHSWVEWNVQQYADQPLIGDSTNPFEKTRNDRWERICNRHDCSKVGTTTSIQTPSPSNDKQSAQSQSKQKKERDIDDIGGKYNGDNWNI